MRRHLLTSGFSLFTCLAAAHAQAAQTPPASTGSIAGMVVSAGTTPDPIRRALVTLGGVMPLRTTVTDDAGRFSFANLPAGRFTLVAAKAAYVTTTYGATDSNANGLFITLAADQQLTNVSIRLPRGAVITGIVKDQNGEPMLGVDVVAYRATANDRAGATPPTVSPVVTDDRGEYRIFGLAAGTYMVGAFIPPDTPLGRRGGLGSVLLTGAGGPGANAARTYYKNATVAADATPIVVKAGEEKMGVDITIKRSAQMRK